MITGFNERTKNNIGCYVYRLVDPRTGQTFYVGKGKGNRVFDHIKMAESLFDENNDKVSLKYQTIKDIQNEGLEVIHIIHRWNMSDDEALLVESALIDCYPGLANIQSGHDHDHGIISAQKLDSIFNKGEFEQDDTKFIIIKVKQSTVDDSDRYTATRQAWRLSLDNVENYQYVFSVTNGIVEEIYDHLNWEKSSIENRIEFTGKETTDQNIINRYKGKMIPSKFSQKGQANPCLYSDKANNRT